MSFEVSASQRDQTLPMILTLRGDETIVEEFGYDSDQAMNYLGIKRSRLNQISGRELRVARIRRDRYIRPVYRECDLKDYLDWTRATATHLSSSKAIEQAVENLDDRFNDVLQVFNEKLIQVSSQQQTWMKGEFENLPSRLSTGAGRASAEAAESLPGLHREGKLLRRQNENLRDLQNQVTKLGTQVSDLGGRLDAFLPEMKELNVGQRSLRFDVDQKFDRFLQILKVFEERAQLKSEEVWDAIGDLKRFCEEVLGERKGLVSEELSRTHSPFSVRHRAKRPAGYWSK